ncbi:class I SAM-dependent methyltransferase [Clostridium minihomine]|uniref:class I SAM-dependent methyltransferase n=1 Tax=Clostridium minihomine TaxID=2045012 RepID=UPI0013E9E6EF|nr:class I SAM-dependent methyltransferase [Clostridium minihomine]
MKESKKIDYANWIPLKVALAPGLTGGILALLFFLSFLLPSGLLITVFQVLMAAAAAFCLLVFGYLICARRLLSYQGGGIQGKILDNVLHFLSWDGNGQLLDIGCGSGALTIKAAKKYPQAHVVGIDYWGNEWDYAQSQCETNAALEGVIKQTSFQKGDAAQLDFPDAHFDAAVSNFVFHEVRSQPDKLALIREALRVLKPGAPFAFEDIFYSVKHYPDLDALLAELSKEVQELHFVDTRQNNFVPLLLKTPMVAGNMGLIWGKK